MFGKDEMAERLLLEAMAAVDGSLTRWRAECDRLRERDASTAAGVKGAYSSILPAGALRDATASIYAEIAHRLGWLELDRVLSAAESQRMNADIHEWVTQDRTLPEVMETFGPPSLWIGGTNRFYPKTLAYTTNRDDDLICFHLWNAFANTTPEAGLREVESVSGSHDICVVFAPHTPPVVTSLFSLARSSGGPS